MTTSSQFLLTFLLNACWQILLVTVLAVFASWLFRNSPARYRHWIWVAALLLSFGLPLTTSSQLLKSAVVQRSAIATPATIEDEITPLIPTPSEKVTTTNASEPFLLSRTLGFVLFVGYLLILSYSTFRLFSAWFSARRLKLAACSIDQDERIAWAIERCTASLGSTDVQICTSTDIEAPVTIGARRPLVIFPDSLMSETDDEVLLSALGHELIHVKRRDYAFNLFYEILFLPLSFHPAAGLIRRRIRQTRELSCDELVAERILNAEVYARSLVQLASSVPTLRRLSATTTVGIADADILEARIMSLLKKSKLDTRKKRMILIGVSLLLLVPCFAAASYAMKFDLQPKATVVNQEPKQEKQRKEPDRTDVRGQMDMEKVREMKEKMEADPAFREEILRKQAFEIQARGLKQAALAKVARISMDQAIQIATAQKAGTVMQCSLEASHWKELGQLADDAVVFYQIQLVGSDDVETGGVTHIWVNAVDGSIVKTEKELPRKPRPE
ncbi:MAG TPA: M56 family metallopeptidase [Pyrinomonadaceae bacterium]